MKEIAILFSCLAISAASSYFGYSNEGSQWSGHLYHQPAPLNHDGTVAETPEVLAAKAHHLAAHAEVRARHPQWHDDYNEEHIPVYAGAHHQYYSPAPLNHDGTVAETPEVKAARLHHLAAHAAAKSKAWYHPIESNWDQNPAYASGHLYNPAPLNHDGTVAETHEVRAARAEHLAAHAQEKAKHTYPHLGYSAYNHYPSLNQGPHDTPEVELAKAQHHAAFAKVLHRHRRGLSWLWSWGHGPAPLNHDGTVAETPEVQAAKAVHFAAHAQAKSRTLYHTGSNALSLHHGDSAYTHHATVSETPEVQAAKAAHFAAHEEAKARTLIPHYQQASYAHTFLHGAAPLNIDGTVAETPEVHAARLHHLAAHAEEKAKSSQYHYSSGPSDEYNHLHRYRRSYFSPAPLNHDGTVAETPEVHAAKAAHLAAVAHAKSQNSATYHDIDYIHHAPNSYAHSSYHAPLNHDGTVAETPEVLAAKAHHFAAHAEANSRIHYHQHPVHIPSTDHYSQSISHQTTISETPEVLAAKAHHFSAHREALSRLAHSHHY